MARPKLGEILDHKFIVFDTNIFIKALKHFHAFEELLRLFKESKCIIVHFPLIEFEFTRDAFIPEHRKDREDFLVKIGATKLPISDQLVDKALEIAKIYSHKGISAKQVSVVDCCIAAYLKQHADNLFLLTLNHKDFPLLLFDRVQAFALDADDEVLAPAVYKFSKEKWFDLKADYEKIKNPA